MTLDSEIDAAVASALQEHREAVDPLIDSQAYKSGFVAGALWATKHLQQKAVEAFEAPLR